MGTSSSAHHGDGESDDPEAATATSVRAGGLDEVVAGVAAGVVGESVLLLAVSDGTGDDGVASAVVGAGVLDEVLAGDGLPLPTGVLAEDGAADVEVRLVGTAGAGLEEPFEL